MFRPILFVLAWTLLPQEPVPLLHPVTNMPSFAVSSVRPVKPGDEEQHGGVGPDGYHAGNTTLRDVIAYAFGTGYDGEVAGEPSWVHSDRFDVQGKVDEQEAAAFRALSRDDREEKLRLMVQSLLKERFHLKYHFATKEMAVYRLQIAKGGLLCKRDVESKSAIADPSRPRFRWSNGPAPPPPPPGYVPPSPAEMRTMQQNMHMRTRGWPFWLIASSLSHQSELGGKPVIDETGLEGPYDCDMVWSREGSEGTNQYLFQAIQTQMGLRLVPSKGLVEVLVVDGVERPSEN